MFGCHSWRHLDACGLRLGVSRRVLVIAGDVWMFASNEASVSYNRFKTEQPKKISHTWKGECSVTTSPTVASTGVLAAQTENQKAIHVQ